MEQLIDALIAVAVVVIPALGAVAVQALRRYLASKDAEIKANMGINNYYLLETFARNVVEAAQQSLGLGSGEDRKEFASELLQHLAEQYNIPVSDSQIDSLVEAAVLALKRRE